MQQRFRNMAACGPADVGCASARAPRPFRLRATAGSLPLRSVRFHKHRASCVSVNADLQAAQQQQAAAQQPGGPARRAVAAGAAASHAAPVSSSAPAADEAAASRAREEKLHGRPGPQPRMSVGTAAVHGGELGSRARQGVADALTTPIVQTSTYTFKNTRELIAYQEGTFKSFEYGRYGNPTARAAEEKLMAMEGAEDALLSASGMCSATTMLLSLVPAGGHIVTTTDCYRRTRQFIQTMLPKMGISCTVIDPSDLGALAAALERHKVSLFFSESPTNPYLRCVDIPAVAKLCRAAGALVCIDSTFATPCNQRALELGADLVIHSATK
jgi:cystathionine gamma-synthase